MHHTKDKGDLGMIQIMADLSRKGFKILTPLSEHLPFDIVAYHPDSGDLYKVQCKYKSSVGGVIKVDLRNCYSSSKGCSVKRYDLGAFDVLGIYAVDIDECLYVKEDSLSGVSSISISHKNEKSRTAQIKKYKDYLSFPLNLARGA